MAGNRFYSDEEAEQILRLAASKSVNVGGLHRDDLVRSAAELGISEEALAEAELQIVAQREDTELRKEFKSKQRREFMGHFWSYISVNLMLVLINVATIGHISWAKWSIFGWGIGVLLHFFASMIESSDDYQRDFEKFKARKQRKAARAAQSSNIDQDEFLDRLIVDRARLSKLEAIKELRDETGWGLREAKDAVEEYERRNQGVFG